MCLDFDTMWRFKNYVLSILWLLKKMVTFFYVKLIFKASYVSCITFLKSAWLPSYPFLFYTIVIISLFNIWKFINVSFYLKSIREFNTTFEIYYFTYNNCILLLSIILTGSKIKFTIKVLFLNLKIFD